jgi:dethiobiotin synthetase
VSVYFVTGTDTGVGKTRIATGLTRDLVRQGRRVAVMKPVAAGARRTPEGLRNEDAEALLQAANVPAPYATVNPYCFEPPISPHIAAKEANTTIDIGTIAANLEILSAVADEVIVEGAGGWLAPISDTQTMADIASALSAQVLLVVGVRLGCLNHALLTRLAIESTGLRLGAWVANVIEPQMPRLTENLVTLERLMGRPPLKVVPYDPTPPGACA